MNIPLKMGGTGGNDPLTARQSLGVAESGRNLSITEIAGLTTALSVPQGGTGSATGNVSNLSVTAQGASASQTLGGWFSSVVFGTPTVSSLRTFPTALIANGGVVRVPGYYAAGDGGGGSFLWSSASTAADDGGTVINPIGNVGAGRWLRIVEGPLTLRQMGARGDFVATTLAGTDDSAAVQAWINACFAAGWRGYAEAGNYQTAPVTVPGLVHVSGAGIGRTQFFRKPTGLTAALSAAASTLTAGTAYGVRVQALDSSGALVADLGVAVLTPTAGTPSIVLGTNVVAGASKFRLWLSDPGTYYGFLTAGYWEVAGSQLSSYAISGTAGTTAGVPTANANIAVFNGTAVPIQGARTRQWPSFSDMSVFGRYQPPGSAAIRGASSAFAYVNGNGGRAPHYARIYGEGFYDAAFRNEGAVEGYYNQTTVLDARYGYSFDGTSHDHWSYGAQAGECDEGVTVAAGASGHRHEMNSYGNRIVGIRDASTRAVWKASGIDRNSRDGVIVDVGAIGPRFESLTIGGNGAAASGTYSDIVINTTDEVGIQDPRFSPNATTGLATVAYNILFNGTGTVVLEGETQTPGASAVTAFTNAPGQIGRMLRGYGLNKMVHRQTIGKVPFSVQDFGGGNFNQGAFGTLQRITTNATQTSLTGDGNSQTGSNTLTLPNNGMTTAFSIYVCAYDQTGSADAACWKIEGAALRLSGVGSVVFLGTPTVTQLGATSGAASWAVSVAMDTSVGAIRINVTGAAGKTIYWGAGYRIHEVG